MNLTYDDLIKTFPGTPRGPQDIALKALAEWLPSVRDTITPSFMGCDAPTGVGKSFLAIALARAFYAKTGKQVWIVTQNKMLQAQYMKDFPENLFELKGLSNYQCDEDTGKSCDESKCGRVKAPEGTIPKFPDYCTRGCEYDRVMRKAREAPILMLNAAKALNILKTHGRNPRDPWLPNLFIYDEGHSVEPQFDSEASLVIKPEELDKLGLRFSDYFERPRLGPMDDLQDRLLALKQPVAEIFNTEFNAPGEFRDTKRLRRSESILNKIEEVNDHIDNLAIEYVNGSEDYLDLRPLQIFPIFRRYMKFPTLFMSATLLSKKGFCATIGIPEAQMRWVSVDSPFEIKNRPIHNAFAMGAPAINYGNQDQQAPNVLERVKEIMNNLHPNDKGIIHSHTYKWAMKIYEINRHVDGRLLYPRNAAEQKDMLRIHTASKNTVLLSPSMTEGVDLKGDLARFTVLTKVPYLPINDPVVKARMEHDDAWYGYRSIMTMIQASGRGVRSTEDFCAIYLLDPGFVKFIGRYRDLFPKWFLDAYQRGKYMLRV